MKEPRTITTKSMQEHIKLALALLGYGDKTLESAIESEESLGVRLYLTRLKTLLYVANLYGEYDLNKAKGKIELRSKEETEKKIIQAYGVNPFAMCLKREADGK